MSEDYDTDYLVDSPDSPEFSGALELKCTQRNTLRPIGVLGRGSFGVVVSAAVSGTCERVAIKRVRCDPRIVSREAFILKDVIQKGVVEYQVRREGGVWILVHSASPQRVFQSSSFSTQTSIGHPNIVRLHSLCWSEEVNNSNEMAAPERYLHLIMSCLPSDLRHLKSSLLHTHEAEEGNLGSAEHQKCNSFRFPLLLGKLILFQVARALAFLHHRHVCHRDLKPSNILVDRNTGEAQLCDLGSAKEIHPELKAEKNVSYICSRFYRAPELLFGSMTYDMSVDMWSFGCLVAELLRPGGRPLFRGRTTVDQMAEIFKVLGTPSVAEMTSMNPQCAAAMEQVVGRYKTGSASPSSESRDVIKIRRKTWERVLEETEIPDATRDLLSRLVCYAPENRLTAAEVVQHPFFDDLFTAEGCPPHTLGEGGDCASPNISPNAFTLCKEELVMYSEAFTEKMAREAQKISRDM